MVNQRRNEIDAKRMLRGSFRVVLAVDDPAVDTETPGLPLAPQKWLNVPACRCADVPNAAPMSPQMRIFLTSVYPA